MFIMNTIKTIFHFLIYFEFLVISKYNLYYYLDYFNLLIFIQFQTFLLSLNIFQVINLYLIIVIIKKKKIRI